MNDVANLIRAAVRESENRRIEREAIEDAKKAGDDARLNQLAASAASKITGAGSFRFRSAFELLSKPLLAVQEPLSFSYRKELYFYLVLLERHYKKVDAAGWSAAQEKEFERIQAKQAEIKLILEGAIGEQSRLTIQQQRELDFIEWMKKIPKHELDGMKKLDIHNLLIKRNSRLWTCGFPDFWKKQNFYKRKPGRKAG
jgi:hypothetical protein